MKVLVIGRGFIASHINYGTVSEYSNLYTLAEEYLSSDEMEIRNLLLKYEPDVVVNCMGYCGIKNIDDCETNKDKTLTSNLIIPTILANECHKLGIQFIHVGSGCIFYGISPNAKMGLIGPKIDFGWKETDTPKNLDKASFYSRIKYACDLAIGNLPNTCILRIRMPISDRNNPRNLINKLLKYENVLEMPNSVTFLDDLVKVIDWAIHNNKTGIYHVTNPTPLTHIQLLEEYRKYHPEHSYHKINEQELQKFITAPRSNCLLDNSKLTSEGFVMTPTIEALEKCIESYCRGLK